MTMTSGLAVAMAGDDLWTRRRTTSTEMPHRIHGFRLVAAWLAEQAGRVTRDRESGTGAEGRTSLVDATYPTLSV
jgi:hypothetical protein